MSPAGPLFFNDVPYPWNNLNVTSASRLNSTDALLVDVIHTDGDARYLGYIPQVCTYVVKWFLLKGSSINHVDMVGEESLSTVLLTT